MAPPRKVPRPRAIDPALRGNLVEIATIAFEVGASIAYLIREPQAMWLRDDHGQPLTVGPVSTALVLLFPCRTEGEPGMEAWPAGDERSKTSGRPLLG